MIKSLFSGTYNPKNLKPQDLLETLPDGAVLCTAAAAVLAVNNRFIQIAGGVREDWTEGRKPLPFPFRAGETLIVEFKAAYRLVTAEVRSVAVAASEGGAFLLLIRDVTETRKREDRDKESLERLRLAFQGARDGLWDWDLRANKIHFSQEWKRMVGCADNEIKDNPDEWFKRVHDQDMARLKTALQSHLSGETPVIECQYRILHKNFTYRWMLCRGAALRDDKGKAYRAAGLQVDITDHKNAETQLKEALDDLNFALASERLLLQELDKKNKELTELSITDGLTRLYNHRFLQERFDFEFNRARRYGGLLSSMLIDIDHFKKINDTHGHQYGDYVLRELSKLLKGLMRDVDICGRYGGEEFMVITNLAADDAVKFANRIHDTVESHTFQDNGVTHRVTISIGVAEYKNDVKSKQELIERSDTALYQAKDEGRNCVRLWKEQEKTAEGEEPVIDHVGVLELKNRFNDLSNRMRSTYIESTNALVNAIDAKDQYTREHSQNVANYAEALARALKLPDKVIETVHNAALLHDVGKIGIPQEILLKTGKLSDDEFEIMRQHPVIGANILKEVRFLEKEIPLILHHHERFDGRGYPHGLKGFEIPLGARILAVADAFDAMTTNRPYRERMSREAAVQELRKGCGKQFSQEIVEAFVTSVVPALGAPAGEKS